ncbi:hypothetical protein HanRHA438_Chr03g0149121 [Helianthus annuus]|uniref:Uncharacterized protein n=1 Tax=Helianthus annuus TaxID=4232 RepID=A0A9K3JKH7_HELAN|nr:hypothetical protein HanXRQr2_Chr03g0137591 [Helianthus annuus]KAJ0938092.1 hypothetical protein HanRHA438_Chr03g0149121 [Helianthus annuus]
MVVQPWNQVVGVEISLWFAVGLEGGLVDYGLQGFGGAWLVPGMGFVSHAPWT